MPRNLSRETKDHLRSLFLEFGSIRQAAKVAGTSRNAAKRFLREEGLSSFTRGNGGIGLTAPPKENQMKLWAADFTLLEKLFDLGKEKAENLSFTDHIRRVAESMAVELNISNTADQVRLETAIGEYILYRRFYLKSVTATDESYEGPFKKAHDKLARAVASWVDSSNKALGNFLRIIRELEIKNQSPSPNLGRGNFFVQQQINLNSSLQGSAASSDRVSGGENGPRGDLRR